LKGTLLLGREEFADDTMHRIVDCECLLCYELSYLRMWCDAWLLGYRKYF